MPVAWSQNLHADADCVAAVTVFALASPPPSVNAMYANRKFGKGRGRIKTAAYTAWIRGEMSSLLAQRAKPVPWPVDIRIEIPARMRGDVDGRIKGCVDLLVQAGIIPDDGKRFVHSVTISRGDTTATTISVVEHVR